MPYNPHLRHGEARRGKKTPEYLVWAAMRPQTAHGWRVMLAFIAIIVAPFFLQALT